MQPCGRLHWRMASQRWSACCFGFGGGNISGEDPWAFVLRAVATVGSNGANSALAASPVSVKKTRQQNGHTTGFAPGAADAMWRSGSEVKFPAEPHGTQFVPALLRRTSARGTLGSRIVSGWQAAIIYQFSPVCAGPRWLADWRSGTKGLPAGP